MRRRSLFFLLTLALGGCDADNVLVGRWRAADGSVLEFFEDGTMNIGATASTGARFRVTDSGLQVEQQLIGPVTLPLELMGDSFHVEGRGVLGSQRITYYRDTGEKPQVQYGLSAQPTARGTCSEQHKTLMSAFDVVTGSTRPRIKKQVALELAFTAGDLMLDPLTHAFTQTITVELRTGEGPGGAMLPSSSATGTYQGRFEEHGETLRLIYQDAGSLTHIEAKRNGDRVVLPAEEFVRDLKTTLRRVMLRDLHAPDDTHNPAWGDLPKLTYEVNRG